MTAFPMPSPDSPIINVPEEKEGIIKNPDGKPNWSATIRTKLLTTERVNRFTYCQAIGAKPHVFDNTVYDLRRLGYKIDRVEQDYQVVAEPDPNNPKPQHTKKTSRPRPKTKSVASPVLKDEAQTQTQAIKLPDLFTNLEVCGIMADRKGKVTVMLRSDKATWKATIEEMASK